MATPTIYTTSWCPYCRSLKRDLAQLGVRYDEVDVDHDREAASLVESLNNGNRTVPTVVYPDGSHATNPPAASVMARLEQLDANSPSAGPGDEVAD